MPNSIGSGIAAVDMNAPEMFQANIATDTAFSGTMKNARIERRIARADSCATSDPELGPLIE